MRGGCLGPLKNRSLRIICGGHPAPPTGNNLKIAPQCYQHYGAQEGRSLTGACPLRHTRTVTARPQKVEPKVTTCLCCTGPAKKFGRFQNRNLTVQRYRCYGLREVFQRAATPRPSPRQPRQGDSDREATDRGYGDTRRCFRRLSQHGPKRRPASRKHGR